MCITLLLKESVSWGRSRKGSGGFFEPPKTKWKNWTREVSVKTFRGHTSLTNTICYLLKNDWNEKEKKTLIDKGESFPDFQRPVDSIFEETQEWFLEHMANTHL